MSRPPTPSPDARPDVRPVLLTADDFGLSGGISGAIAGLARQGRISATSAIVTPARWRGDAGMLAELRGQIAIGLHLNLTLGAPLGAMAHLAPGGSLPPIGRLTRQALAGRLDVAEIAEEVRRQLALFIEATGFPPDHIDGHQHAHALPGVRDALLQALAAELPRARPLLRDPADLPARIFRRGGAVGKALAISLLARGFGALARHRGYPTNKGFSGVSAFDRREPFAGELSRFLAHPGPAHLVMCHPGRSDAEDRALDPLGPRRDDELAALEAARGLGGRIWHPDRTASGPAVDWRSWSATALEPA